MRFVLRARAPFLETHGVWFHSFAFFLTHFLQLTAATPTPNLAFTFINAPVRAYISRYLHTSALPYSKSAPYAKSARNLLELCHDTDYTTTPL